MKNEHWVEAVEKLASGNDCAHLNFDFAELQRAFTHVYWIGGSGCAGKSTIAKKLAAQYGLAVYHCDDHGQVHSARVESEQLPLPTRAGILANIKAGRKAFGEDQADIDHGKYLVTAFAYWQEEFTLVLDDLRAMPAKPMIVEGVPIVPWLALKVAPPQRVATLVGCDSFRRRTYMNPDRPEIVLKRFKESYDSDRALENILQANVLIAGTLLQCTQRLNGFAIAVDGSMDADAVAWRVADHFRLAEESGANTAQS